MATSKVIRNKKFRALPGCDLGDLTCWIPVNEGEVRLQSCLVINFDSI